MWHLEEARGSPPIDLRRQRRAFGRSLDRQPRSTEEQQIKVELARPPAPPLLPPELALEALELDEELGRPGRRGRTGWDVQREDGIEEVGLVRDPDRLRSVEAGHATEARTRQGRQRGNGPGQRPPGVPDVRSELDVHAHSAHDHLVARAGAAATFGACSPLRFESCTRSPTRWARWSGRCMTRTHGTLSASRRAFATRALRTFASRQNAGGEAPSVRRSARWRRRRTWPAGIAA